MFELNKYQIIDLLNFYGIDISELNKNSYEELRNILDTNVSPEIIDEYTYAKNKKRFLKQLKKTFLKQNPVKRIDLPDELFRREIFSYINIQEEFVHGLIDLSFDIENINLWIQLGADVNQPFLHNGIRLTPLMFAAAGQDIEVMKLFLKKGARINDILENYTALLYGLKNNPSPKAIEFLIVNGADPNLGRTFPHGDTPIHIAVQLQKKSILSILLSSKIPVNINVYNLENLTPLEFAIYPEYTSLPGDLRNDRNLTFEVFMDDIDVVKYVLEHGEGINVSLINKLLMKSIYHNKYDITLLLLPYTSDIEPDVIHAAAYYANSNILSKILQIDNGKNINTLSRGILYFDLETPLISALSSRYNTDENVDVLLTFGANVNIQTPEYGVSPLHLAVKSKKVLYVEKILKSGADVNVQNYNGDTPLLEAVKCIDKPTISLLLKYGADPTIKNKEGETPISFAKDLHKKYGIFDVLSLLLEYENVECV